MNKPIAIGFCILDLSKYLMYDFHYNVMKKKYGNNCEVLYTDTDSLIYNIQTDDLYDDFKEMKDYFDLSEYPADHKCFDTTNKKVIGKFKCETNGVPIEEFIGIRAKMYSVKIGEKAKMRGKGIKASAMKKIDHSDYYNCLFGDKKDNKQDVEFKLIKSINHKIHTINVKKVSLCCFDDKRYYLNMTESRAHGHYLNTY